MNSAKPFRIVEWSPTHRRPYDCAIDEGGYQFNRRFPSRSVGFNGMLERLLMSFQPEPPSYWIG